MPSFSHSKLTTYQQCPQKYKFRYIDEIPPPIRSIELHLGDTVHRTLEKLYADAKRGQTHSCDEILAFYQQKWDEGYTEANVRCRRLLAEYGSEWLADFKLHELNSYSPSPFGPPLARGFPESARMTAAAFLTHREVMFARFPVLSLDVTAQARVFPS